MTSRPMLMAAAMLGAAFVSAPAMAHPKVMSATPAAGSTVAATNTVNLTFNEKMMPKLSTATLAMTAMPGMAHHPEMKVASAKSAVSADGKSLVLTNPKPLTAGTYRVDWVIVGADGHRVTGQHAFSVR